MRYRPLPKGGSSLLCLIFFSFLSTQLFAQPTIVTAHTATGSGSSSHALTSVPAGALLVLACQYESSLNTSNVSSSPSLTWTKRVDAEAWASGDSEIWTAVYTAGGNITVSSVFGGGRHSNVCYVITGQETSLGGATGVSTGGGTPNASITTTRANSIIIGGVSDYNSVPGGTRSYTGSPTETFYAHQASTYTTYNFYKAAATATNYNLGVATPTGQSGGVALYEIRVPSGGGGDTDPPSSFTLSVTNTRARTVCLSWTEATDNVGIDEYDVYVGGVLNGTTASNVFTYTVENLTPNTGQSIYVKAKDAATNSTNSNTVTPTTMSIGRSNLIEELTFEQSAVADAYLNGWINVQHSETHNVSQTSATARNGSKALKIDLRVDDEIVSSSRRAEIEPPCRVDHETMERWYGGSWYLVDWDEDNFGESILQWHDMDGSAPPLAIQVYDDHLWLKGKPHVGSPYGVYDLGAVVSNEWIDIVLHVKWAYGNTGMLQVWRNGVKLVDVDGISTNSLGGSYLKLGINKWNWAPPFDPEESEVEQRVFYIDDFRIGNENASYADVAPSGQALELNLITANSATGTGSSVHSLTSVPAGALLVLACQYESSGNTSTVSSSPSLTWTKRVDAQASGSGDSEIWTAVYTAGGNITVTSDFGHLAHASVCYVITGAEAVLNGAAESATGEVTPQVDITTTAPGSIIIGGISDWNARDGSARVYRGTPVTETLYHRGASTFGAYNFYKGAATEATYTLGLSSPLLQSSGVALYEIRPEGSGASMLRRTPRIAETIAPEFTLRQNFPNPSHTETTIQYGLPKAGHVNLTLMDLSGRVVKVLVNGKKEAGLYNVRLNVASLSKGVYYYRMQSGDKQVVKKLLVQ